MKVLYNLKNQYSLDAYSLLLFLIASFAFPQTYNLSIIAILIITAVQVLRVLNNKVSIKYVVNGYFLLLVLSLPFYRSVHTLILVLNILFNLWLFFKEKPKLKLRDYKAEVFIFIFFIFIFINGLIHKPILKDIDTYLYLLFYPVLFILIKVNNITDIVQRAVKTYITSVLLLSVYLVLVNLLNNKLSLTTNTFFSESSGMIHVYFGMYLGLAIIFLILLYLKNENYINKKTDRLVFLFFFLLLVYIGARTALFGVLTIISIAIYKKVNANQLIKITISVLALFTLMVVSYKKIPRIKNDMISFQKMYVSIETHDKEDLINNSWSNVYKRYLVLDYSIKEIKNHFVLGIGLGNVTHKISDQILNDGYKYFQPMNTHNQYLHFLLGLGALPFLYFMFILYRFKVYNPEWIYFLIFFLLIMLTESILVRVKGISLFFLFYLALSSHKNH